METQNNGYGNILKAMQSPQKPPQNGSESNQTSQPSVSTPTGLSMSQKAQNYKLFDELMKNNIDLSEVIRNAKKSDDLQKQLDSAKRSEVDTQLFSIMENAVKGDDNVKKARQKASEIKTRILTEMCIRDPEYAEALHEYRRAVNEAYINLKEKVSPSE